MNWLSVFLNLSSMISNLSNAVKNVSFKVDANGYIYVTSDAFEVTVFVKDKRLMDFIVDLVRAFEVKRREVGE